MWKRIHPCRIRMDFNNETICITSDQLVDCNVKEMKTDVFPGEFKFEQVNPNRVKVYFHDHVLIVDSDTELDVDRRLVIEGETKDCPVENIVLVKDDEKEKKPLQAPAEPIAPPAVEVVEAVVNDKDMPTYIVLPEVPKEDEKKKEKKVRKNAKAIKNAKPKSLVPRINSRGGGSLYSNFNKSNQVVLVDKDKGELVKGDIIQMSVHLKDKLKTMGIVESKHNGFIRKSAFQVPGKIEEYEVWFLVDYEDSLKKQ